MFILDKNNLLPYLKSHYPAFDTSGPVTISAIGDGEDEIQGLINYLFRVSNSSGSLIVKQGRTNLRLEDDTSTQSSRYRVPPERNYLEYASLKLRHAITPQYVPEVYYVDRENNIFFMEDVSYLKPGRTLLSNSVILPNLGRQCAEFLADIHFYTSEFYMDTEQFRQLSKVFTNTGMRRIMENWLFLRETPSEERHPFTHILEPYIFDQAVVTQSHLLRHKYMGTTEAFIHSDVHTSNLFADDTRMKVIDMEYTFAGPCAYDLGYLLGSLCSQFCSAVFRPFPCESDRAVFKQYILETIYDLLTIYRTRFAAHWTDEAKEVYRSCPGFREAFLDTLLPDIVGYSAMPMLTLCVQAFAFPQEFESIPSDANRLHALQLYCAMARLFLLGRQSFHVPEDVLSAMVGLEQDYFKCMQEEK